MKYCWLRDWLSERWLRETIDTFLTLLYKSPEQRLQAFIDPAFHSYYVGFYSFPCRAAFSATNKNPLGQRRKNHGY
jgi:hypothetical protein